MKKRFWKRFLITAAIFFICTQIIFATASVVVLSEKELSPIVHSLSDELIEEFGDTSLNIVAEDIDKRSENVKHYRMSDGSYRAAIYDEPVHYRNGEKWDEIDNTLTPANISNDLLSTITKFANGKETSMMSSISDRFDASISATGLSYLENANNSFKVQFPSNIRSNLPIVISKEDKTICFQFEEIDLSKANVLSPESSSQSASQTMLSTNGEIVANDDGITTLTKNHSALSYTSILPDVDLHYYLSGCTLKEMLILRNTPATERFSFNFAYTNLRAVLNDDNSVSFFDETDKTVFFIAAPYMYDSNDVSSNDITVDIVETEQGCKYTIAPDLDWLEDSDRAYPVVIDPTISSTQNSSYIHDNGVQQSNPTTNYKTTNRIYVGSSLSGTTPQEGRMYIKLTQWPSASGLTSSTITSAYMNLFYYPTASWQTANQLKVNVYKVNSSWNTDTITWNNQTSIGGSYISSTQLGDRRGQTSGYDKFDVTKWVQSHYANPSADQGIRLQPATLDTAKSNRVCYISSDYAVQSSRPQLFINYTPSLAESTGIVSGKIYNIWNVNSHKFLDVRNGDIDVVQHYFNVGAHQKWKVVRESDGYYSFSPASGSYKVLDLSNGLATNGNPLWSYEKWESGTVESQAQRYAIIKVGSINGKNIYKIASKKDLNKVVEVRGASNADNAIVQVWDYVGQTQQQWVFEIAEEIKTEAAFSLGNDNMAAFNSFISQMTPEYLPTMHHTYNDAGISKDTLLDAMSSADLVFLDSHAYRDRIVVSNGDKNIVLADDIGKAFSGRYTTQTPFNKRTKWMIIQACHQLDYFTNTLIADEPVYQWAKALLGAENRMHGVLGYYNIAPADNKADYMLKGFFIYQLRGYNVIDSWQHAHEEEAKKYYDEQNWAAVYHVANQSDNIFAPWTANTSPEEKPQIYVRGRNKDGVTIPFNLQNSQPVSCVAEKLSGKENTNFRLMRTPITSEIIVAAQNSLLNDDGDMLETTDSTLEFSSKQVVMNSNDVPMDMSAEEAVDKAKQILTELKLMPTENYTVESIEIVRTPLDMESAELGDPETLSWYIHFYPTYNGTKIYSPNGDGIHMQLCANGVGWLSSRWSQAKPIDAPITQNSLTSSNGLQTYYNQHIDKVGKEDIYYEPIYMYEDDNATLLYKLGVGKNLVNSWYIDATTGEERGISQ